MSDEKPNYPRGQTPYSSTADEAAHLPEGFKQAPTQGLSEEDIATLRKRGFNYVHANQSPPAGMTEEQWRTINAAAEEVVKAAPPVEVTPYSLPPITLPLVSPQDVLEKLRRFINKGYMPSATGARQYNSKPEYMRGINDWMGTNKPIPTSTGFFKHVDELGYSHDHDPIWAFIITSGLELACNLHTDELYCRLDKVGDYPWVVFDKPLSINPHEFHEVLENFL